MKKIRKIGLSLLTISLICLSSINQVYGYSDHFASFTSYNYKGIARRAYTSNVGRKVDAKDHVNCFYDTGSWLYCIENGQELTHSASFDKVSDIQTFIASTVHKKTTAIQKQKWLSILMALVPNTYSGLPASQSEETYLRYSAASTIVWEIMDECRDASFQYIGADSGKTAPIDGNIYTTSSIRTKFDIYYNEYVSKVLQFEKIPSFSSLTLSSSPIYDMNYNPTTKQYEMTLQDQENVLNNYVFSNSKFHFEKSGNTLKITTPNLIPASATETITLSDESNHLTTALIGFQASVASYQKLMCTGELNPPQTRAYFRLKTDFGSIELTKTDSFQTLIDGAVFHITNHQSVDQDVTVKNGKLLIDHLKPGIYEFYEVKAPEGYLLNSRKYSVQVISGQTTREVIVDDEPTGTIRLKKKINADITQGLLGDAYVSSITYGLYAKETISNASKSHTYYSKDQCISTKTTDHHGLITWNQLPMGKYYIKELKSNDSLLIDETPIDVELSYVSMHQKEIEVLKETTDSIASQRIQIFKEGIKEGEAGIIEGLPGAQFTFVLNSEYEDVGFDKAYHYYEGTTDENGFLTTPLLPYGLYRVKETKTPEGYYGASDFLIRIEKDHSLYEIGYKVKKVTVNNVPFVSLLKIVKVDQETGKIVQKQGATFKIKNLDTQEYVSYIDWSSPQVYVDQWTTHSDGTITLNTKLDAGHYALEEIQAPECYSLKETPLEFEISQNHYEIAEDGVTPITIVHFSNEPVKGKITIEKKGEVLVDYRNGKFIYEKKGLEGVEYGLYAKEDILDPSNDQSVLYHKGECVDVLKTSTDGIATSIDLPLGQYYCQELKTIYGYVLDQKIKTFSLEYVNQNTRIIEEKYSTENTRQKINILVSKNDEDTKEYLSNAIISLYTNEDIYNVYGQKIVSANTLLMSINTSQDGLKTFPIDLPIQSLGQKNLYRVVETKQPDGYLSKDISYDIDAIYTGQPLQSYQYQFMNKQTQTMIHKIDKDSLEDLKGALLQVIDLHTHEIIDEWVSDGLGHLMKGLIVGHTYILHEEKAPIGYTLSEDMTFMIEDIDEVKEIYFENEREVMTLGDEPPVTSDNSLLGYYIAIGLIAYCLFTWIKKKG